MNGTTKLLFGAIVFNMVLGVGCSTSDEDEAGAASGSQDVTTPTTTPDKANERLVALLRAGDINRRPGLNVYEGYLTNRRDCRVNVTWYEGADFLTVSTTEVTGYGLAAKPVGESLDFEIQGKTSYRTNPLNPDPRPNVEEHADASKISKWKDSDGTLAFTV